MNQQLANNLETETQEIVNFNTQESSQQKSKKNKQGNTKAMASVNETPYIKKDKRPRPAIGEVLTIPSNAFFRLCKRQGSTTFRCTLEDSGWRVRHAKEPYKGLVLRTNDKYVLGKEYLAEVIRYTQGGKGDSAWVSLKPADS